MNNEPYYITVTYCYKCNTEMFTDNQDVSVLEKNGYKYHLCPKCTEEVLKLITPIEEEK